MIVCQIWPILLNSQKYFYLAYKRREWSLSNTVNANAQHLIKMNEVLNLQSSASMNDNLQFDKADPSKAMY